MAILSFRDMARHCSYNRTSDLFVFFISESMGRASDELLADRVRIMPARIAVVAHAELARRERLEAE